MLHAIKPPKTKRKLQIEAATRRSSKKAKQDESSETEERSERMDVSEERSDESSSDDTIFDTDASLTGEDRALTEQYIEEWVGVLI